MKLPLAFRLLALIGVALLQGACATGAPPRSAQIDGMADKPFLRKVTLRLPRNGQLSRVGDLDDLALPFHIALDLGEVELGDLANLVHHERLPEAVRVARAERLNAGCLLYTSDAADE